MLISKLHDLVAEDYSRGNNEFPDREKINPEVKKGVAYCVKNAKAIFSGLMNNENNFAVNEYRNIQTLRDYADGNQTIETYLESAGLATNDSPPEGHTVTSYDGDWNRSSKNKRKGLNHINTKIVSIAPKIINRFRGLFAAYEEDIFVNNIDEDSGAEEEKGMYKAFLMAREGKWIEQRRKNAGIEMPPENRFPSNISIDELQAFYDAGGFKLDYARIMEKVIRYTQNISDWPQMKDKYAKDLLALNFICGRVYYDVQTDEEKWSYLDPMSFTIQRSKERDYNDAEYGGYFFLEKVTTLLAMGFNSEELKPIAKRYCGYFGNAEESVWDSHEKIPSSGDDWFYGYKIPVFTCAWIDSDISRELDYTNVYGKRKVIDLKFDDKVKPLTQKQIDRGAKQSIREKRELRVYQCNWLVGSDLAYEYGLAPCQIRSGKKGVKIPFFAEKGSITDGVFGSVIESITPFLDQIQIAWYQLQDLHARMLKGGYMINLRLMSNLKMGGETVTPEKALAMAKRSGILPYMDTMIGDIYRGGDVVPLHRIEGGMGNEFQELLALIKVNFDFISDFTGMSPVKLGAVPAADQPVSTVEMSAVATEQISRPLIEMMFSLKEKLATSSSKRIQILVKSNSKAEKTYQRVVGARDIDVLKNAVNLGVEYGIRLEARPDEDEKKALIEAAQAALQRGRDGEALIDFSQYTYIIEQAKGEGNLKELRLRFAFLEQREKERQQLIKERNRQLEIEGNRQTEQMKRQYDVELENMKLEGEIIKNNNEFRNQMKLEVTKQNNEFLKLLVQQINEEKHVTASTG